MKLKGKIIGYTCKNAISWQSNGYNKQILICANIYKDKELAKSIYTEGGIRKIKIEISQ